MKKIVDAVKVSAGVFVAAAVGVTMSEYFAARRIKIEIAHQEVMCQVKLDAQKETDKLKDVQIELLEKRQQHLERMHELKDEKIELLEKLVEKYRK